MALDTVAIVEAGIEDVFDSIQLGKPSPDATRGRNALMELQSAFISLYIPADVIAISDATDADGAAFFASTGQGKNISINQVFETSGGTADWTDNALATAKGGAVASGDKFQRTSATAVKYLGADFTFTGEADSDW